MQPTYYIGCSGFSFRDWKGVFYPEGLPPRKWFAYCCTQFNTLELNVTIYRMPEPKPSKPGAPKARPVSGSP